MHRHRVKEHRCFLNHLRYRMISTPTTRPSSSSDLSFFSSSKGSNAIASSSSNVVVRTRITHRPAPSPQRNTTALISQPNSTSSPDSSPLSSPPSDKKRKSSPPQAGSALPREVKRLRASASNTDRPRKRPYKASSKRTSRAPSYDEDLLQLPEPIYRSSRSRSTSTFQTLEDDAPILTRTWITPEDGEPGPSHLSSEMAVKRLMKSYKACKHIAILSS